MLLLHALSLLAGAATVQLWPTLPPPGAIVLGVALGVGLSLFRPLRLIGLCLLGAVLAAATATLQQPAQLAAEQIDQQLEVRGRIAGLPQRGDHHVRFRLQVEHAESVGQAIELPDMLRLSWYAPDRAELVPGEVWQFSVRVRQPRGFSNPGGFDYPRWLFQQGIGATGHVIADGTRERVAAATPGVHRARAALRAAMPVGDLRHPGTLTALAIGDRGRIDDDTWNVLLATGTNHLVAISGLHVGLAALAGFAGGRLLWHLLPCAWRNRMARPVLAAVTGLALAAVYAALAGFAIPTQRALVMLAAGLGTVVLRRRAVPSETMAIALIAVLLFDPLAPMAAGFWLSFGAVAAILWVVCGRVGRGGRLADLARLQLAIGIALAPLVLLLFARTSIAGPIANLVAVPWVSLLVVPPTLVGAMLSPWLPTVGGSILQIADLAFTPLWWFLEALAAQPWSQLHRPAPKPFALVLGGLAVVVLLAPRGIPGKPAALICLLPLLLAPAPAPREGGAWLEVLDAGGGVASIVRTADATFVHDSGPALSPGLDGGSAIVVPFLRESGTGPPAGLLISREHARHAGGWRSLVTALPPAWSMGPPQADAATGFDSECRAGRKWRDAGVEFALLHPRPGDEERLQGADLACVLRIDAPGGTILLAAGIGHRAEWFLLTRDIDLDADILVVAEDGPMVDDFIAAVAPQWVIHTGGSPGNGGPWPPVDPVWREAGHARTDCGGRIRIVLDPDHGILRPQAWRETHRRFWHHGCDEGAKSGTMRAVVGPGSG